MKHQRQRERTGEQAAAAQFDAETDAAATPAWEEVAAGRYMPRRIKGSCKGRALG